MGKLAMKLFGSSLFGQATTAAGVGAALLLSVSAGYAQSGPFVGFDGAWSGTGSVTLSDGSNERIRCRANYQVNSTGYNLKQALHCASDSYKFDLTSDVTTQGPDYRALERNQPQRQRQPPGHGRWRFDRRICRGGGFCRDPQHSDKRQQAGRADQFQGRDSRRQHYVDQDLSRIPPR